MCTQMIMTPFSFWIENQEKYPAIASVAFDILTIPGSSAAVERVFLHSWACYDGKTKTD